mmetsp:Transcript_35385/g.60111  ORF Transcript_35385/g.60111 Transcript_35385/m.60111 type:complete len:149 (-) Transcript_35385:281-727(-)|eukprot:CAMPEP_0183703164 /NCGR_PEP_ID=MMETSP0737-20130205/1011_1 /TAXON_ID=385413 /ORGANISM="Thalassiosira miniscula, Strain CCMP1093" /LENGTH=148 /DNA_ID=CAMNT_0025929879 /DNA_START=65 /DNA_END=511 /DNA_ORIENTATION=+
MSRFNISHQTIINAPVNDVWKELIAIDSWNWNRWTKLKAETPAEGVKGKLLASYEGNEQWKEFDFQFGRVSEAEYLLSWLGSVGPKGCLFSGHHAMQLEIINESQTRLIHREEFGGLLPNLGLGLPYKTLNRNYLLMNESLKNYVEEK